LRLRAQRRLQARARGQARPVPRCATTSAPAGASLRTNPETPRAPYLVRMRREGRWAGVGGRRFYSLVALLALFSLGIGFALIGGAAASKTTPLCKSGQTSSKAHPCIPLCKTGQKSTKAHPCAPHCKAGQTSTKAHPCIKAKTAAATTTTKAT